MFESTPGQDQQGERFGKDKMDDEKLLREYGALQEDAEDSIRRRNRIEKTGKPEIAGSLYGGDGGVHTTESTRDDVEYNFATLNAMRTEIENRGLHAPTMEDRAKEEEERRQEESKRVGKPVDEHKEGGEGLKVTVTYTLEDWATHQTKPVSMEFSGANMEEISDKVVQHLVGLEISGGTEIATNTKVRTPDGEVTFNEFFAATAKK